MMVLIDARFYGLENAGLGRYSIGLINALSKLESNIKFTILLRNKYFKELQFPANWTKVKAEIPHYSFSEQLQLPKIIHSYRPDLVHFLHFNVPVRFKGEFVVTIHDLLMHRQKGKEATTLPLPLYYIKRLAYSSVFKKAVHKSSKIIAPSDFVKKDLVTTYKIPESKVQVVYEGLDKIVISSTFRKGVLNKYKINEPYFIYTGNAYPHKNLKRAIEAVSLINKKSKKKVVLVIASARNVFTKRVEAFIKQEKATEYIQLLGFVPDREIAILYANSVGFLYPSLEEGFGLPGLEAVQAGTVALVSDIPVFKEIYKTVPVYFNPYDFTSIASAMEAVLTMEKPLREKIIKRGQEFARRYSWDKCAKETLEIYKSFETKAKHLK